MQENGQEQSNPNIRRWLSWIQINRLNELPEFKKERVGDSTSHFWINRSSRSKEDDSLIEAADKGNVSELIDITSGDESLLRILAKVTANSV